MDDDMFEDLMMMDDVSFLEQTESYKASNPIPTSPPPGSSPPVRTTETRHMDMSQPLRMTNNQVGAGSIIAKLEDILVTVVDCLLAEKPLVIHLKTRSKSTRQILDPVTGVLRNEESATAKKISWPGRSQREAWKFSALLSIITLSHEALVTGVVTTKRDIYYRDPELFVKQAVVDRYIDDLAYTLSISRHSLNIVATAKGLIAGCLGILKKDNQIQDCSSDDDGILIPDISQIKDIFFRGLRWILVIEKEATWRSLVANKHTGNSRAGKGLIVTAKGFPDISTRAFIHTLRSRPLCPPIYALTDCDPHGLSILSTYAHGSSALAHENANLAVPDMRWLGVKLQDVIETQSREDEGDEADVAGVLSLTLRDRKLATNMLGSNPAFQAELHPDWRRELQCMLFMNVKAEIQILGGAESLGKWVDKNIRGWESNHPGIQR